MLILNGTGFLILTDSLLTKHMLHSPHLLACIKMSNLLLPNVNEDNCITLLVVVITLDLHIFQNVVASLNFKGMICDSSYLFSTLSDRKLENNLCSESSW